MKYSHLRAVQKETQKRTEELREYLQDLSHKITEDQMRWLDKAMMDLLPPDLYQAGKHGDMEREIGEYLQKNGVQIVFVPDSISIRITVKGKIHSQFAPKFTVDGEPVELKPTQFISESPSNN